MQPEKIIVDILQNRMALPADYGEASNGNIIPSIMIGSQNALLGATDKLQIVVYSLSDKVIAHNRYEDTLLGGGYQERIEQIIFSTMQVDIQSRDNSARDRRSEVLAALHSTYAQQKQEALGCRLNSIRNCDKILVLDQGALVEEGTHAQLMERDGLYAAMYNSMN